VKILYVSQYFPPEMGAPAARAAELSRHWARMGHDVTVLTGFPNHPTGIVPEEWRSRLANFATIRNRRWRAESRAHMALAAAQPQSARTNPQLRLVLHLSCAQRAGIAQARRGHRHVAATAGALSGWWLAGGSASPLFLKSAISGPNRWRPSARAAKAVCSIARLGAIAGFLYRRADRIVVVTPAFKDHLIRYWNVPAEKISTRRKRRRDRSFPPRPGSGLKYESSCISKIVF
jgi:colanic acid biosynthesis glycosyl transferase WcaI